MPNHKPKKFCPELPAIFPSLISADLLNLESVLADLDPHCAGYHLDIMDNQFVPNLTWGPAFINAIASKTKRTIWVHLMVANPDRVIDQLKLPEDSVVSVHLESVALEQLPTLIQKIKDKKWRPSLAVKPKTPISTLEPYLDLVDHVLLMSVEPGFSGQKFLPEAEDRIDQLLLQLHNNHSEKKPELHSHTSPHHTQPTFTLALDGGITQENIARLASKGVTQFAIAHALFSSPDPVKALEQLKKLIGPK
jgi:ribulose-phosphate 3-epimerase